MKNGIKILLVLTLSACFNFSNAQSSSDAKKNNPADKFTEIMGLVRNYYVDTVNEEKITEDAIQKALEDLDPHSSYTPAKDVNKTNEHLVGNFEGIGISFQILKDTILVLEVIPSGPSEKVGLQAGDKVVKVNDTTVAGIKIDNSGVISKLRGPKGTKVKVSIMRQSEPELIDFTITRDKIPIFSVTAYYMAAPGVGYVRIESFAANTMREFMEAVEKLRAQGMQDIIIDLENDPGGYLYTAVDLCNQFLGDHQEIVSQKGLHSPFQPYYSNNNGMFKQGRVVVLVDESSASASEIFSGCMQDNDRGLLVGRRTFGKGLVQKPFSLTDGSEVKITTAHYYTPSGRCIQKSYASGIKDYREDYKDRYESGELFGKDTFKYADSLKFKTLNGRIVYGGGGVMPDFFVAFDTSANSALFNQLVRRGVENKFCLEYVEKHRQELNKLYTAADSFYLNFAITKDLLAQYFKAAVADSVIKLKDGAHPVAFSDYFGAVKNDTVNNFERDYAKSEKVISARLRATIGRNLFDVAMYYRIINSTLNNTYAKAIEVMNNPAYFDVLKPRSEPAEKTKVRKPKKKVKLVTTDTDK